MDQPFLPPSIEDNDRLARIQPLFPEIDAMYRKFAETNRIPGYAYGIFLDDRLIHTGSGGFINLESKAAPTPQSMFRIASMTKSFTAMAIIKLRDEGKLRLDDRIDDYIPELKKKHLTQDSPAITIRDLLTHTAGYSTDDPWADRKLDETEEQLLALIKDNTYFSNPCSVIYEYSNLGYTLLGYLISKITGIPYQEYIDTAIFKPIGMDAYWEYAKIPGAQLAHGYSYFDEKHEEEPLLHDGIFAAMGGLITSIEAFGKYIALHQYAWPPRDDKEAGPIKRSSLREMQQPWRFIRLETGYKYASGNECSITVGYGYGLRWIKDSLGRVFVGHTGGLPGFGSDWLFLPEYGLGVVAFGNRTYAEMWKVDLDVLDKIVVEAKLPSRQLLPSKVLQDKKDGLISVLPDWNNIPDNLFAPNFFLDRPLKVLQKESQDLFSRAGKIVSIGEIIPENQLRGHFTITCEKQELQVHFSLTPEIPCLLQHYQIKVVL